MMSVQKKRSKFAFALFAICLAFIAMIFNSCGRSFHGAKNVAGQKEEQAVPNLRVHFPFDQDEVFFKDLDLIAANAEWLKKNNGAVVILEGHCDEHGPNNYNMELGDKRARTIKHHLIKNGVPHEKIIMVVSYGEKRPADPKHTYDAWKKNRRVEFILR